MSQDREENWFVIRRFVPTIDPMHQSECKSILNAKGYKLESLADVKMCHPEGACQLVFENSAISN